MDRGNGVDLSRPFVKHIHSFLGEPNFEYEHRFENESSCGQAGSGIVRFI